MTLETGLLPGEEFRATICTYLDDLVAEFYSMTKSDMIKELAYAYFHGEKVYAEAAYESWAAGVVWKGEPKVRLLRLGSTHEGA